MPADQIGEPGNRSAAKSMAALRVREEDAQARLTRA